MFILYLACLLALIVGIFLLREDPKPILGVYSQPGKWYWLKYAAFYVIITLRRRRAGTGDSNAGYGRKARSNLEELEKVQKLSEHPLAIDAAYFNGYDKEGFYFGAGVQRRPEGRVESLMFMLVPEIGILDWPFSPSTATTEAEPNTYSAQGGLRFERITPFKKWRVTFDGQLKSKDSGKLLDVKFDFLWSSASDWFDFDTDMHPKLVCDAIAREPWNKAFFNRLRDAHQTHHEQYGIITGSLSIQGFKERQVELCSWRDHSFGLYRNWKDFYRYALHYLTFDDGHKLALLLICMKPLMTHLVAGFMIDKDGKKTAIDSCNRRLYNLAEEGILPEKFDFTVTIPGAEKKFFVEVEKLADSTYFCGWEREARLHPMMCKAKLNGINGVGMCEFEYTTLV